MSDFIKDTVSVVMILFGVIALTFLLIGTPMYFMAKYQCGGYAEALGFEYKYSLATKCVIKTPQGWVRSNKYIINSK